jgi:outer membrane immunogenic protein
LGLGAQIGGRYYFNNNWGINLELGGANTTSGYKIGASYRF